MTNNSNDYTAEDIAAILQSQKKARQRAALAKLLDPAKVGTRILMLRVRLDAAQYARLLVDADKAGKNVSDYVRGVLFE